MDSYLGEIKSFAGDYAPVGWMLCRGQLLSISDYQALYSILGTQYGGNGITNFALPDLQGRSPIGTGSGPGLTTRSTGQFIGNESIVLTSHEVPSHLHSINNVVTVNNNLTGTGTGSIKCLASTGNSDSPKDNYPANAPARATTYSKAGTDQLNPDALQLNVSLNGSIDIHVNSQCQLSGNSQAHNNMQPWACVNFIICYNGVYPPHS